MESRAEILRQKAKLARRLMTATDDRVTLHELKTFAHECEEAADRLAKGEPMRILTRAKRPA